MIETLDDIYDKLGGAAAVGRAVDVPTEHAAAFKRRRSMPPRYWPKLLEALHELKIKVTHDDLVRLYNQKHEAASEKKTEEGAH